MINEISQLFKVHSDGNLFIKRPKCVPAPSYFDPLLDEPMVCFLRNKFPQTLYYSAYNWSTINGDLEISHPVDNWFDMVRKFNFCLLISSPFFFGLRRNSLSYRTTPRVFFGQSVYPPSCPILPQDRHCLSTLPAFPHPWYFLQSRNA